MSNISKLSRIGGLPFDPFQGASYTLEYWFTTLSPGSVKPSGRHPQYFTMKVENQANLTLAGNLPPGPFPTRLKLAGLEERPQEGTYWHTTPRPHYEFYVGHKGHPPGWVAAGHISGPGWQRLTLFVPVSDEIQREGVERNYNEIIGSAMTHTESVSRGQGNLEIISRLLASFHILVVDTPMPGQKEFSHLFNGVGELLRYGSVIAEL